MTKAEIPRSPRNGGSPNDGEGDERCIIHVDMDAFFASVEILQRPELRGRPVIVGGDGPRGVVASCSYEARFFGVRSAMPSLRAKQLCPQAVFISGRYSEYEQYSRKMHEVLGSFTPLVEGISLDEAFLDVTGVRRLFGTPKEIAWRIKNRLYDELGLHVSAGVASTKHVAKLASEAAKPTASRQGVIPGKGVVVVPDGEALSFLHSLEVRALWGVGPAAAQRLNTLGITTVGQLSRFPLMLLAKTLGEANARHIYALAWNQDYREVVTFRAAKSVGHEQTFRYDLCTDDEVHYALVRLADAVAGRLRAGAVRAKRLTVKVRFGDFITITRSQTLTKVTANAAVIVAAATDAMAGIDPGRGIRLLGVSMAGLEPGEQFAQLSMGLLEDDPPAAGVSNSTHRGNGPNSGNGGRGGYGDGVGTDEDERLDATIDEIRARYGEAAVVPGRLVGPGGPVILRKGMQQWGPDAPDGA